MVEVWPVEKSGDGLTSRPSSPGAPVEKEGFKMIRIEGEILINRPPEEVFDFIADERNEPLYNPRMRHAEQISDGPIGVGTRFRSESASMGRPVEMIIEVTDYQRPRKLASSTHMPPWTSTAR